MAKQKKYLFIPLSSFGYLFPSIKLAHMLMEDGHDVLFATTIRYGDLLNLNGIPSVGILNQVSEEPFLFPGIWYCDPFLENTVNTLSSIVNSYQPDAIISNPLGLAAMIMAEKYNIPFINIGFSEYLYPGIGESNPTKEWRIKEITEHYNFNRKKLHMPSIEVSASNSPLIGDRYFIRNIPEFDDPRKLPAQVSHIGALYWEPSYQNPLLSNFIAKNKQLKRPIVYMQIGRLFGEASFWQILMDTLDGLPYAFVADLGRADYLQNSPSLPENVFGSPFIPLGHISSEVDFVISSAQSTSMIAAILHEKPILCIPHSADGHEMTQKVENKKIGIGIVDKSKVEKEYFLHCFEELRKDDFSEGVQYFRRRFLEYENKDFILEAIRSCTAFASMQS